MTPVRVPEDVLLSPGAATQLVLILIQTLEKSWTQCLLTCHLVLGMHLPCILSLLAFGSRVASLEGVESWERVQDTSPLLHSEILKSTCPCMLIQEFDVIIVHVINLESQSLAVYRLCTDSVQFLFPLLLVPICMLRYHAAQSCSVGGPWLLVAAETKFASQRVKMPWRFLWLLKPSSPHTSSRCHEDSSLLAHVSPASHIYL